MILDRSIRFLRLVFPLPCAVWFRTWLTWTTTTTTRMESWDWYSNDQHSPRFIALNLERLFFRQERHTLFSCDQPNSGRSQTFLAAVCNCSRGSLNTFKVIISSWLHWPITMDLHTQTEKRRYDLTCASQNF